MYKKNYFNPYFLFEGNEIGFQLGLFSLDKPIGNKQDMKTLDSLNVHPAGWK